MADSKLSSLTSASALDGTELLYAVQSSADRKALVSQIKTYVLASSTGTGSVVNASGPTLIAPILGNAAATTVSVGANGGTTGAITLFGGSTGSCRVEVSSVAGSGIVFRLPTTNGSTGQLLQTDGTGKTSWVNASGTGDMLAANNLSDVASTVTALSNLGGAPLAGNKNLTGGFTATSFNIGSATSGTLTINPLNGYIQHYVNAGAHSIAAPTSTSVTVVECVNSSAGNINFGNFTFSTGDNYSSTGTRKHIFTLIKTNTVSEINIKYVAGT